MLGTGQPKREQTGFEDWLDTIKGIYSSPTKSTLTKITTIALNPVILCILIALFVLIFYVIRCRRKCEACPAGETQATTSE